jgi:hypothetical protein
MKNTEKNEDRRSYPSRARLMLFTYVVRRSFVLAAGKQVSARCCRHDAPHHGGVV